MIYPYESIRSVHLELTDRCNAACPMCPRFVKGEVAPHIQNIQFSLDDIRNIFPVEFIKQLNRVNFCGNYGDPIVAKDLLNIIAYLRHINDDIRIEVNTNGSARKEVWWKILAGIMGSDEKMGGVWFGLDGLSDTNHLYRRNTNWEVIMRNVKAFIEAGGIAHWNFIAFRHNEHQIDEARALAEEMGFKHFNIKITSRFDTGSTYPVIVKGKHVYDLEIPTEKDYLRPEVVSRTEPREPISRPSSAMLGAAKIVAEYRRTGEVPINQPIQIVPKPNIECIAQRENSIYVSATGHVYPCCWIGNGHSCGDSDIIMDNDRIDITKHSIEDIINGEEFQMVQDSWEIGSIRKCVNICTVVKSEADKTQYGSEFVIHKVVGRGSKILRGKDEK